MHGSLQVQYQVSIVHHAYCLGVAFTANSRNFFNEMFSKSNSRKFRPAKYKRHTVNMMFTKGNDLPGQAWVYVQTDSYS